MNDKQNQGAADQAAAFQKIWTESVSKTMQAAFNLASDQPPPQVLRQIRSGILRVLAESWEEFMRSPQFLEGMKQWMEGAIAFRSLTNESMNKMRHEMQAPSREDIDTIMVAVRHIEKRLLDRIEQLSTQVNELKTQRPRRARAPRGRPTPRRRQPDPTAEAGL